MGSHRRNTVGYDSYRGRGGKGKIVLAVLLLVALAAACAFLYVLRFVSYTDDGEIHINLPFLRAEKEPGEANLPANTTLPSVEPEEPDIYLTVDRPGQEDKDEVVKLSQKPYGERRLVELETLPGDGDALAAALSGEGANGFVYTVKDHAGLVRFRSEAALPSAVWDQGYDRAALEALCSQEGTVSVARLNCFHDSYYAWTHTQDAAICGRDGKVWIDAITYNWLEPDKEAAREYIISLAKECAELGFDELLLDEVTYPLEGKLELIDYSGNSMEKTEALVTFLRDLRSALVTYDVKLSLLLDPRALTRDEAYVEASGVDLTRMLPMVDAVYVETMDTTVVDAIVAECLGDQALPNVVAVATGPMEAGYWFVPAR